MSDYSSGTALHRQLADWVTQGLMDEGQAARIAAAEAAGTGASTAQPPCTAPPSTAQSPRGPSPTGAAAPRRLPLVVEALGYLGTAIALGAAFVAVGSLRPRIPVGAELAFATCAAVALLLAGIILRTRNQPAFGRLRSVLWLASAVSLAAAVSLFAGRDFWDLGLTGRLLVPEAVATAYAAALWWHLRATLQHLAVFVGLASLATSAIARGWPGHEPWAAGLGLWLLSLLWGLTAYREYLAPRTAGYAAAGVGLLVGAQLATDPAAGQALAVATVVGLLTAGVVLRRVLFLGLGALGAIEMLPRVANRYLPSGPGAAFAILAVGLAMVGVAVWLAKSRQRAA
jgi:hypothetical protein